MIAAKSSERVASGCIDTDDLEELLSGDGGAAEEAFADAPELRLGLLRARSVDEEGHGPGFHGAVHFEIGRDNFADGVEGVDAVAKSPDGVVFFLGAGLILSWMVRQRSAKLSAQGMLRTAPALSSTLD